MNYAEIKEYDIANGPGVRITLFVSGCRHHCKGCFNQIAWDFQYGRPFDDRVIEYVLEQLGKDMIRGLTLLGGEPLDPLNQSEVLRLVRAAKTRFPEKDIWCYTGYLYEKDLLGWMWQECREIRQILPLLDVLVDGPFIEDRKDISLRFRGSANQRLIDMHSTLERGEVVLWQD